MVNSETEMREVTKLVLYGWGYPSLFQCADGSRLQNRLVSFRFNAAPVIEGASKEKFSSVFSRLELVRGQSLDLLKSKYLDANPAWIWVDAPESLSVDEVLAYRKQFEAWSAQLEVNSSANRSQLDTRQLVEKFLRTWLAGRWKPTIVILFAVVMFLIGR